MTGMNRCEFESSNNWRIAPAKTPRVIGNLHGLSGRRDPGCATIREFARTSKLTMRVMSASSVSRDCFFDMHRPPFGSRGAKKYDDDPPIGRPGMENCTSRMMIPDVKSIVIARRVPKFGGRHLRELLESGVEGGFGDEADLFGNGQDRIVFIVR